MILPILQFRDAQNLKVQDLINAAVDKVYEMIFNSKKYPMSIYMHYADTIGGPESMVLMEQGANVLKNQELDGVTISSDSSFNTKENWATLYKNVDLTNARKAVEDGLVRTRKLYGEQMDRLSVVLPQSVLDTQAYKEMEKKGKAYPDACQTKWNERIFDKRPPLTKELPTRSGLSTTPPLKTKSRKGIPRRGRV
ncbi:hypothetical protein HDU88_007945 [Geranomyces variabilis]|nr:hypothetical protein HDU88_007945 [Geranomyces variabilis]